MNIIHVTKRGVQVVKNTGEKAGGRINGRYWEPFMQGEPQVSLEG